MRRVSAYSLAVVCVVGVSACSKSTSAPATPTSSSASTQSAGQTEVSLKVSAPTALSPINGQQPQDAEVTLVVSNATGKFGQNPGDGATYHFQVYNASGQMVYDVSNIAAGATNTANKITVELEGDKPYSWQARLEIGEGAGPWSPLATFVSPVTSVGYIRGNELYDPLINGQCTQCAIHGPATWIPGRGLRLESQLSFVAYQLGQTLLEGEFSMLVTDLATNTEGGKTKLFAMAQGFDDIVTNDRRMTVEKRGDPAGVVAWRFITHDDQVDTEGAERQFVSFDAAKTYFWQATWRNNFFNVLIREGGVDGQTIYSKGKHFDGLPYDPNPHVIYLGSPVGRSGPEGASVDHVTYRQVWVSGRGRPGFINK